MIVFVTEEVFRRIWHVQQGGLGQHAVAQLQQMLVHGRWGAALAQAILNRVDAVRVPFVQLVLQRQGIMCGAGVAQRATMPAATPTPGLLATGGQGVVLQTAHGL